MVSSSAKNIDDVAAFRIMVLGDSCVVEGRARVSKRRRPTDGAQRFDVVRDEQACKELPLFCRVFISGTAHAVVDSFDSRRLHFELFPAMVYVRIKHIGRREEDAKKDMGEVLQRSESTAKCILIEMRRDVRRKNTAYIRSFLGSQNSQQAR